MRRRIDPSPQLQTLAALQAGVVSTEQATGHGLGRHSIARLLGTGNWQQLAVGIYLTRPRPGPPIGLEQEPSVQPETESDGDWMSAAWAGILIGGDSARLGELAAAYLHGLVGDRPDRIVIHIDHAVRRQNRGRWEFRREVRGKAWTPPRGSPPRIGVEDLVLNLIDDASRGDDRHGAAHWVTAAVQRRLTTPERLLHAVQGRQHVPDRELLLDLLTDVGDGSESPLELRYLNDIERAHGLPRGRRQSVRRAARFEGTVRAYRDVFYEEFELVVELDGRAAHVDEGRLRDLRRDNVSALRGERSLRYGWIDVTEEPCLTAVQVAGGLRLGGWQGAITRCRRCRDVPEQELWELGAG